MLPSANPWEAIFRDKGRVFSEPHEDMPQIVSLLRARAAQTILDVGCGTGRHVVYFAHHGFSVSGIDHSPAGIALTQSWLHAEGLSAMLCVGDIMEPLPYKDACFDAVISTQVIHHAVLATIKRLIKEIERVLKDEGFVFITVPKLRNQGTRFEQIEPDTFIPLDGPEKGLPHHYFTPEELQEVFGNLTVMDIHLDSVDHHCLWCTDVRGVRSDLLPPGPRRLPLHSVRRLPRSEALEVDRWRRRGHSPP
jgi:SAM-dependent methyltransferase